MTADEKAPECQLGAHHYCTGPKVVRREGAPPSEMPIMTLRCGCTCHRRVPRSGRAPQA